MHNNYICVSTILQMSACAKDKTTITSRCSRCSDWWLFLFIYSLSSTCFLHNHQCCPIIRSASGQAVNQRFTLLRPISPCWWILMGSEMALHGGIESVEDPPPSSDWISLHEGLNPAAPKTLKTGKQRLLQWCIYIYKHTKDASETSSKLDWFVFISQ